MSFSSTLITSIQKSVEKQIVKIFHEDLRREMIDTFELEENKVQDFIVRFTNTYLVKNKKKGRRTAYHAFQAEKRKEYVGILEEQGKITPDMNPRQKMEIASKYVGERWKSIKNKHQDEMEKYKQLAVEANQNTTNNMPPPTLPEKEKHSPEKNTNDVYEFDEKTVGVSSKKKPSLNDKKLSYSHIVKSVKLNSEIGKADMNQSIIEFDIDGQVVRMNADIKKNHLLKLKKLAQYIHITNYTKMNKDSLANAIEQQIELQKITENESVQLENTKQYMYNYMMENYVNTELLEQDDLDENIDILYNEYIDKNISFDDYIELFEQKYLKTNDSESRTRTRTPKQKTKQSEDTIQITDSFFEENENDQQNDDEESSGLHFADYEDADENEPEYTY